MLVVDTGILDGDTRVVLLVSGELFETALALAL